MTVTVTGRGLWPSDARRPSERRASAGAAPGTQPEAGPGRPGPVGPLPATVPSARADSETHPSQQGGDRDSHWTQRVHINMQNMQNMDFCIFCILYCIFWHFCIILQIESIFSSLHIYAYIIAHFTYFLKFYLLHILNIFDILVFLAYFWHILHICAF